MKIERPWARLFRRRVAAQVIASLATPSTGMMDGCAGQHLPARRLNTTKGLSATRCIRSFCFGPKSALGSPFSRRPC